ncbi:MAG: nucleotide sugar dehydrogenase [Chloroflexota bacterium]|jgi:UDP-N-acetyl-D-mannosaminuronic acid dehydrogenase|nr:nucleotide sugar dehydrogenase [Chloroflexota bacterium]MDH5243754.1 nucleotide sugar dehydrogenase [Chloroflexota bacterium]
MSSPSPDLDVVVLGGGGHVGLPLSLAFAKAGLRVGVYDTNQATLDRIADGQMPFLETGADELLVDILPTGRLELSADAAMIERTDQLVVVIGTPVDEFLGPSMTIFEKAVGQIAPHLRDGALVVLRSTVYPGTTAYVTQHLADAGCRVDVAFCPERIAEGHALEELESLPQIIGADEDAAAARAASLFRRLAAGTIRTSSKEAELAKLFTNTWRYMKFAVANQFFMIADQAGVDYTNVLRAVREDYPRAADLPGPGFAAGPCLFKDAMQLAAFTSDHFPMGQAAMQVNEGLPAYIVGALEQRYGGLKGKTVGILGMAFKAESDDPRASLSYKLRKLLSWSGARVLATDPYVLDDRLVPLDAVLADSDILILGAPHRPYRDLQIGGKDVVDVWGALGGGIRL